MANKLDVAVMGELNLDLIMYGLPDDLEPEREHLASRLALTLGSSSAIFSHNLSVLGTRVGFISRIGDDPLGNGALQRLAAGGVDVSRVRKVTGPASTGLTIILPRSKDRYILTYPGTMFEMNWDDVDLDYLASARHFHLSSFFLHRALRPRIAELFRIMKQRGLSTSLDTNDDPEDRWEGLDEVLQHVDVFLPNEREAMKIAHTSDPEQAMDYLAHWVPLLVVKLGAEGAMARRGKEEFRAPARKVEFVDPVGAGDSFDSGFIHEYLRSGDIVRSLASGNMSGAFSTTQPGGTEAFRDRVRFEQFYAGAGE